MHGVVVLNFKKILLVITVVILIAVALSRAFYIDFFSVPQNGMYPAIPQDSRIFVNKRAYNTVADVRRGDVVVFGHIENGQHYNYIWRVVALPGERVQAQDRILTVNGSVIPQLYKRNLDHLQIYEEQHVEGNYEICFDTTANKLPPNVDLMIAADELFVMGDNRYRAVDSRYLGAIKFNAIQGKQF